MSIISLTGCITSNSTPLAPPPPEVTTSFKEQAPDPLSTDKQPKQEQEKLTPILNNYSFLPSPAPEISHELAVALDQNNQSIASSLQETKNVTAKKCNIKTRFDKDAVLAYEWGRNRLGFDVNGLEIGNSSIEEIKLEYKLNLQSQKTFEQRCRFASPWQGLIGSAYHELIIREDDTIWQELRQIRIDFQNTF